MESSTSQEEKDHWRHQLKKCQADEDVSN